jgi:hypothetical protein
MDMAFREQPLTGFSAPQEQSNILDTLPDSDTIEDDFTDEIFS